jgi:hypothetical protein
MMMEQTTDWEQERDAAVLKRIKRAPQSFEQLQEVTGLEFHPLRESLYRLTTSGAAHYVYSASAWTLPKRRRKLTRKQAIGVLAEAAESWANELTEYIIPADDVVESDDWEDNMSTTANRQEQVDRIEQAVKLFFPTKENQ